MARHHLIYIPGLHDVKPIRNLGIMVVPLVWRLHGFGAHVIWPHWEEGEDFQPKLEKLLKLVDSLIKEGQQVSLVGQSAGGSAALNAFMARPGKINGVVNITGRLRSEGSPSLAKTSKGSPAFADSVRRCEANLPKLSKAARRHIMTIRPSVDTVVPSETVAVVGAQNRVYAVRGHAKGGAVIATLQTKEWMNFLRALTSE